MAYQRHSYFALETDRFMHNYEEFIKHTLDRYKRKSKTDPLICLPVYDARNVLYAYMKPVIAEHKIATPHYVRMLSQWRRDNPIISLGTFEITDVRTERWLDKSVIGRNDRILFIIEDLRGQEIGHLGYSSFVYDKKQCEIDKVLRAVKGSYPGVMHFAMQAILHWGFSELKLKNVTLRVISDNEHAIKFYEKLGFEHGESIPLYLHRLPDETKWEEKPEYEGQESGKNYLEMVFKKRSPKTPPQVKEADR